MKTFDPTKPVQTRDGRPARIVSTNGIAPTYPIIAIVIAEDGKDSVDQYTTSGKLWDAQGERSDDLVNVPATITEFVNLGTAYTVQDGAVAHNRRFPVLKLVREDGTDKVISAEIVPAA
jgi:hypothetical protein